MSAVTPSWFPWLVQARACPGWKASHPRRKHLGFWWDFAPPLLGQSPIGASKGKIEHPQPHGPTPLKHFRNLPSTHLRNRASIKARTRGREPCKLARKSDPSRSRSASRGTLIAYLVRRREDGANLLFQLELMNQLRRLFLWNMLGAPYMIQPAPPPSKKQ